MAIAYDGINYFPVGVNFMEENAMEVIEAKYGIKGSAIVLKLLCKIYKEGYFIHWDEEQCLIFANKAGREVQAAEVQGIIEILFIKGILDRNSYLANGILTSANIQKIWMEATKRRKRDLKALPYLLVNDLTQQETEAPEGENVTISPGNVVHDVAVNAKNACNSGQSKVKYTYMRYRSAHDNLHKNTPGFSEAAQALGHDNIFQGYIPFLIHSGRSSS